MNPIVIPFKTDPTDIVDELTSNVVRDMLADIDATEVGGRPATGWPPAHVDFHGILASESLGAEPIAGGITRETLHDAMRIMGNGHVGG